MKTLKPTSCSPIAITIVNRSHMRHTSSQARQLDPLREARGRLRGSRPPGGCNACPLKRGAVLGSPGRGWRRSAIPSFFSPFSGDVQLSTHAHECKKPGRGSHGTARARIQYHGCLVRGGSLKPGVRLRSTRRNDFPSAPRANARVIDPRFRVRQETPRLLGRVSPIMCPIPRAPGDSPSNQN